MTVSDGFLFRVPLPLTALFLPHSPSSEGEQKANEACPLKAEGMFMCPYSSRERAHRSFVADNETKIEINEMPKVGKGCDKHLLPPTQRVDHHWVLFFTPHRPNLAYLDPNRIRKVCSSDLFPRPTPPTPSYATQRERLVIIIILYCNCCIPSAPSTKTVTKTHQ